MTRGQDDVDSLARAIDRVVFHEASDVIGDEPSSASLALISYLNDSFPRTAVPFGRRERLQRRMIRALKIPGSSAAGWERIESELRRLRNLDPRWTPVVGGAALLLLGVVGVAVWRQRGALKPAVGMVRLGSPLR